MKFVPRNLFVFFTGLVFALFLFSAAAQTSVESQKLRVVTRVVGPFVVEENGKLGGYSIDLWQEVAKRTGLQFDYQVVATVPEMLEALRDGKAEIAVGALTINDERGKTIDFSYPIYESGLKIAVVDSSRRGILNNLPAFYSANLPMLIAASFAVFLLALFLSRGLRRSAVAGTAETGGTPKNAVRLALRIFLSLVALFSISVLLAIIGSSLSLGRSIDIKAMSDLPGLRVGTLEGAAAADQLTEIGVQPRYFSDLPGALKALQAKKLDAVVYDAPMLAYLVRDMSGQVRLLPRLFNRQAYGFGIKDPSGDLRKKVNLAIESLTDEGYLKQLDQKWFGNEP